MKPDLTVDASLYGLWYYGMFKPDDPRIERTMDAVAQRLWCQTELGGLARFEGDMYHWDVSLEERQDSIPGNPWVICTLWLAQCRIARARTIDQLKEALPIFQWACQTARSSGVMAEQIHPLSGQHLGASPLTWSHATFVAAVQEYIEKYKALQTHVA